MKQHQRVFSYLLKAVLSKTLSSHQTSNIQDVYFYHSLGLSNAFASSCNRYRESALEQHEEAQLVVFEDYDSSVTVMF